MSTIIVSQLLLLLLMFLGECKDKEMERKALANKE